MDARSCLSQLARLSSAWPGDSLLGRSFASQREVRKNLQQPQVFRFSFLGLVFSVVSLRIRELFAPALMQAPRSAIWKFNLYLMSISETASYCERDSVGKLRPK